MDGPCRHRLRPLISIVTVLAGVAAGCSRTQVLPRTSLAVTDDRGALPPGLTAEVHVSAYEMNYREEPIAFDPMGSAVIAPRSHTANPLLFVGRLLLTAIFPHSGGPREPAAEIWVVIPGRYDLDDAASGLAISRQPHWAPSGDYYSADYAHPASGSEVDHAYATNTTLVVRPPPSAKSLAYRFVVRRRPPAKQPA